MRKVLVTGSEGLLGRALAGSLERRGYGVRRCDLRAPPGDPGRVDVLDAEALRGAAAGCAGIVHFAAVSRVIHGERDPHLCWLTNVDGTRRVIEAASQGRPRPWLLFSSSREVYGQPRHLPATEDAPLAPVNIYGRSKVAAEQAVSLAARELGLRTAVVRLSNVYGSTADHPDRVVPAFARAAASGAALRVDGRDHAFDFTHLDDTVLGLHAVIEALEAGEGGLPPIHLLTGTPTTLGALAELANAAGGGRSRIAEAPPRAFDVSRFHGDPALARRLLGWRAAIPVEDGVQRLVGAFQALLAGADRPTRATEEA
jgi:nucleoside-diphosphate-sugar epimerase